MVEQIENIVVVGAGQAGFSVCNKLRQLGYDGRITLLGDEPVIPYQRPPLSKAYLLGEMEQERLFLRPGEFYRANDIEIHLSSIVESIDRENQAVVVGASRYSYDHLVLATGSQPRRLPQEIGGALDGVYEVRTLADVDRMRDEFVAGRQLAVIGGGYIGLEAAAVAAKLGLDVTLIEAADRILKRVASSETADYFRNLHRGHGVNILEGIGVNALRGDPRVEKVELTDGQSLDVDFVIVGIGIVPCKELAEAAGLEIDNGIKTDVFGRSSDTAIWAAGDCASFPYRGNRVRLESVPNAIAQAETVAENILGGTKEHDALPWFWSDQYDRKLQIAGLNTGYDRVEVRHGERENAISFWYFKGETLLSVDAVNDAKSFVTAKRMLA